MSNAAGILITGASGLLGANLLLCAKQHFTDAVGIYGRHKCIVPGLETLQADLTDPVETRDLVKRFRPKWIIHTAAMADVDCCEEHPESARLCNEGMTRNIVESAGSTGARVVHISTDAVFNGATGGYSEEHHPDPINVYAATKLAAEKIVQDGADDHLIVRTAIYGWNLQDKLSLAEWVLQRLETGTSMPGFKDVFFSPILVNDLSVFILQMISRGMKGLYHVSGSEPCSKFDFAVKLSKVFNLDGNLVQAAVLKDVPLKALRPKNLSLRTDKISAALGISMPDVDEGVRRFKLLRDSGFVKQLKAMRGW
jgi:dTDP-4-dehydrorhamnose reductase